MPNLFFGKALKVNLEDGSVDELEIEDCEYDRLIGGAPMLSSLMSDAKGECMGLGAGPLTGSPCPGASAGIAAARGTDGRPRFVPILINGGVELKLSGFDFVTVEGRSDRLSYLWIRDGVADIVECDEMSGEDSWRSCELIRENQGDQRIQVISSSEGDSASLNFTSGWDGIGLGGLMRRLNLRAVALRGMGEVEIADPDGYMHSCLRLMDDARSSVGGREGISDLLGQNSAAQLKGVGRARACFSCPYPCMSYIETGDARHPKMLLLDQRNLSRLLGMQGADDRVVETLMRLHRKGGCIGAHADSSAQVLEDGVSNQEDPGAEIMFDTITEGIDYTVTTVICYILGLCPRYVGVMRPDLNGYCSLLSEGVGHEVTMDAINALASEISKEG